MPNIFWYVCLAIIGIGSASYAIYHNKDNHKFSTLLAFYLFVAGFSWIGEFIVLGLFNSYGYKIDVFEDPWAQNLLGHLILNTTLYPAAALVMVAYSFKYGWIAFSAALFTLIEYFFIKFGLYEHHWWRYYMTTITVIGILLISRKVYEIMKKGCSGLVRAIIFFFIGLITVHTPAPILLLMAKQYYHIGFVNNTLDDLYLSSIIIIFFYHLVECVLLVVFTCLLKKWYWKVLPFIISIAAQWAFTKAGILIMTNGWNLFYTLIIYEIFIAAFILVEKYTLKPNL